MACRGCWRCLSSSDTAAKPCCRKRSTRIPIRSRDRRPQACHRAGEGVLAGQAGKGWLKSEPDQRKADHCEHAPYCRIRTLQLDVTVLDCLGDGLFAGDEVGKRRVARGECHGGVGGSAWGANNLAAANGKLEVGAVDAPLVRLAERFGGGVGCPGAIEHPFLVLAAARRGAGE